MKEYLILIPVFLILLSIRYNVFYQIGKIVFFVFTLYLFRDSSIPTQYYLYKIELLTFSVLLVIFLATLINKALLSNNVKVISLLLMLCLYYNGPLETIIAFEFLGFLLYSKNNDRSLPLELSSIAIKTSFFYMLFSSLDISRIGLSTVTFQDFTTSSELIFCAYIYLLVKTFEYFSSLHIEQSKFEKGYSFLLFIIIAGNFIGSLDLHSIYMFDFINAYVVQFNSIILLLCILYKKKNIRLSLIFIATLFSSIYLFQDTMGFILLCIPIGLLSLVDNTHNNRLQKIIKYDEYLLPLSFSFLVLTIPPLVGGYFIKWSCVSIVVILIINIIYNNYSSNYGVKKYV